MEFGARPALPEVEAWSQLQPLRIPRPKLIPAKTLSSREPLPDYDRHSPPLRPGPPQPTSTPTPLG